MKTKKFHAFEDRPPIVYRPGTSDESIIQTVLVEQREYAFPPMKPHIIFDIGANIGVLSVILANIYPDAKIYAFEPVKENFELLKENVASYKNVAPLHMGLGNKTETKYIHKSTDPSNLGGFSTFITDGDEHEEITIIDTAKFCEKVGTPDLIKIDCEGAEFDILTSIPDIKKVKWVTGELHGVKDFALLVRLNKDFRLSFTRNFNDKVWHFLAASRDFQVPGLDHAPQQ